MSAFVLDGRHQFDHQYAAFCVVAYSGVSAYAGTLTFDSLKVIFFDTKEHNELLIHYTLP